MNRDPFLRAALIITATAFVAGLYALFGPVRAIIFAAVGIVLAVGLSVEPGQETPSEKPARPERPRTDSEGKPVDFKRVRG